PWQNPFVERLIGSIRRECLDHVVVLSESHLRRILVRYLAYYHRARTHLSLDKDAPDPRPIASPVLGRIVEIPEVGGLHHRYERRARTDSSRRQRSTQRAILPSRAAMSPTGRTHFPRPDQYSNHAPSTGTAEQLL